MHPLGGVARSSERSISFRDEDIVVADQKNGKCSQSHKVHVNRAGRQMTCSNSVILSQQAKAGHFGLHGMQERAKLMGAKLATWSEADAGTEVELSLPACLAYAKEPKSSWLSRKFAAKA